jgi:hypothetical protein
MCPGLDPAPKDRAEYGLSGSVDKMSHCIFDVSFVKKGGPDGGRVTNMTPNGMALSKTTEKNFERGITH